MRKLCQPRRSAHRAWDYPRRSGNGAAVIEGKTDLGSGCGRGIQTDGQVQRRIVVALKIEGLVPGFYRVHVKVRMQLDQYGFGDFTGDKIHGNQG